MRPVVSFEINTPKISFEATPINPVDFEFQAALVTGAGLPYKGPYEVTPKLYQDIELPTKGTVPKDDITVLKIPQYEVGNDAGGKTLILGVD